MSYMSNHEAHCLLYLRPPSRLPVGPYPLQVLASWKDSAALGAILLFLNYYCYHLRYFIYKSEHHIDVEPK